MEAAGASLNLHHVPVPLLTMDTAEGIRIRTEIAGVGSRLAASFLDLLLIVGGYLGVLLVLFLIQALVQQTGLEVLNGIPDFVFGLMIGGLLLLLPLYFILFHIAWNGQTPGKRSLGIRVVASDGAPATSMQLVLRGLLWPVDALLFLPAPLGLMMIAATPRCRRLGDMAAGTLVLCEPRASSYEEPWPEWSWTTRESKALQLSPGMGARLEGADVVLLRDAICRRDIPRDTRASIYKDLVRYYAEKLGFEPVGNVRTCLKELYLFARETRRA